MPNEKELYKITHSSPELNTVGEFLFDQNSIGHSYYPTPEKFLAIKGADGLTNRERIQGTYKTPEEKKYIGGTADTLPLKVGTVLYVEYDQINKASFVTEGIQVVSTDEVAFKAAKLAELEADQGYKQVAKPIKGFKELGNSQELYPDVTVWIWCRAISPKSDESNELTGQFFDLTPFIQNLTTNMGKNGGNFSIVLPPLTCELDSENKWTLSKNILNQYGEGEGYVAETELLTLSEDKLFTNKFLFHNIISPNDLIFIRFETLDIEKEQRFKDSKEFYIDKKNLANRIYDMIGLVDSNHISTTPSSNDVTINISGRDLSKLFIEDGTYFYALENSQGMLKFAGQSTQKNSQINRVFGDGALSFIGLYMFTSIEYIFKFIIQQLANIKIVPDDLFTSYAHSKKIENGVEKEYDGRNTRFNEESKNAYHFLPNKSDNLIKNLPAYKKPYKEELSNGIWQIIKLVVDKSVTERRLADSSLSTAQGSLLNFIKCAAQEPLVEYYMDTYKDQYHLIIRKPPYDQKALISLIEGHVNTEDGVTQTAPAIIDIEADDVIMEKLYMDDSQVYSWYHFLPKNNLIGGAKDFSLAYLGALYFEEFAQVYGSKPFQQTHPYIPYIPKNDNETNGTGVYERQAINDYKYIVETCQYLPFLRKGTLTLNGDRRIKIGNVIRYKPTGEIFFVDSVQQSFTINDNSVERTTTVNVSRGMVEQLIYGIHFQNDKGVSQFVSYFNIIDTRLVFEQKLYDTQYTERVKVGDKVIKKASPPELSRFLTLDYLASDASQGFILQPSMVKGAQFLEKYNAYPRNKDIFVKFINAINDRGYDVILLPLSTNRTYAEQAALKKADDRNAAAGESRHEYGYAIDITIVNQRTGNSYSKATSEALWRTTGIPQLANEFGLRWGGDNHGTFGTKGSGGYYVDRVHFEIIQNGGTEAVTVPQYDEVTKTRKELGLERQAIFRNFKVNKYAFNFFLKKLQFNPDYREVTSRQVFQTDAQGSKIESGVTVTAKKKK